MLVILLAFLTLSAVSAQNNESDAHLSDTINISEGSITKAISNASDGDIINVNGNLTNDGAIITINKVLTIQGNNNVTYDFGGKFYSGFKINSSGVVFKNLNFINSKATPFVLNNGNATFINCTFKDLRWVFDYNSQKLVIINSTFRNVSEIFIPSYYSSGLEELTVENSRFSDVTNNGDLNLISKVNICNSYFGNVDGEIMYLKSAVCDFTNNTFVNITDKNVFRITSDKIVFKNNTFKNIEKGIWAECDEIKFLNTTFEDFGQFLYVNTNKTDFDGSKFINGSEVSFIYTEKMNVLNSEFTDSSIFRIFGCENLTFTGSRFAFDCVMEGHGNKFLNLYNCEIINSTSVFSLSMDIIMKNTRFINCSESISGENVEVYDCEFINSYNFYFDQNAIIRNCRFADYTGSTGNNSLFYYCSYYRPVSFEFDNCTFENVGFYLFATVDSIVIANSTFRNISTSREWFIRVKCKNFLITNNDFSCNASARTISWNWDDKSDFNVEITNNIFSYANNQVVSLGLDLTVCNERSDLHKNIIIKDNFYGVNLQVSEQLYRIIPYGNFLNPSWINVDLKDLGDNKYQLLFVDKDGNVKGLRDYTFSIKDKHTGEVIISDITLKNGVGNFTCDKKVSLDDVFIIDNVLSRVNRPKANVLLYNTGTSYEDCEIHVRICDENGNPICGDLAYLYEYVNDYLHHEVNRDFHTDDNGEYILEHDMWEYPTAESYTFVLSYFNPAYAYSTSTLSDLKVVKTEVVLAARDFVMDYNSKKTPHITEITKKTYGIMEFAFGLKIYKGSKIVNSWDVIVMNGKALFDWPLELKPGKYRAVIVPDNFNNFFVTKQKSFKITVNKAKTTVKAPAVHNRYLKSQYFKVTVKDKSKNPVKGIKLKIKVFTGKKSKTYTVKTNKKGIAYLNTKNIKKGKHNVLISSNDEIYKVSAKSRITIKR